MSFFMAFENYCSFQDFRWYRVTKKHTTTYVLMVPFFFHYFPWGTCMLIPKCRAPFWNWTVRATQLRSELMLASLFQNGELFFSNQQNFVMLINLNFKNGLKRQSWFPHWLSPGVRFPYHVIPYLIMPTIFWISF